MVTKDEAARRLIAWHFQLDSELREIYRFLSDDEANPSEPIKLLEVHEATLETGRIDAFGFNGAGDIPYPCVLALISPAEMELVRQGKIALPRGWDLQKAVVHRAPERAHA